MKPTHLPADAVSALAHPPQIDPGVVTQDRAHATSAASCPFRQDPNFKPTGSVPEAANTAHSESSSGSLFDGKMFDARLMDPKT